MPNKTSYSLTQPNGVVLKTTISFNKEYDEYVVRLFEDGVEYEPASYHTDDMDDAQETAKCLINPLGGDYV